MRSICGTSPQRKRALDVGSQRAENRCGALQRRAHIKQRRQSRMECWAEHSPSATATAPLRESNAHISASRGDPFEGRDRLLDFHEYGPHLDRERSDSLKLMPISSSSNFYLCYSSLTDVCGAQGARTAQLLQLSKSAHGACIVSNAREPFESRGEGRFGEVRQPDPSSLLRMPPPRVSRRRFLIRRSDEDAPPRTPLPTIVSSRRRKHCPPAAANRTQALAHKKGLRQRRGQGR